MEEKSLEEKKEPTLGDFIDKLIVFFAKPMNVFVYCVFLGIIVISIGMAWQAMIPQYGLLCEKYCNACGFESFESTAFGACSCYGASSPVWSGKGVDARVGWINKTPYGLNNSACGNITVNIR